MPTYSNDDELLFDNSDNNDITFNATLELPILHDTHSDINNNNMNCMITTICGPAMPCTMLSQTIVVTRARILIVNSVIDNLYAMSNPIVTFHLSISMLEVEIRISRKLRSILMILNYRLT